MAKSRIDTLSNLVNNISGNYVGPFLEKATQATPTISLAKKTPATYAAALNAAQAGGILGILGAIPANRYLQKSANLDTLMEMQNRAGLNDDTYADNIIPLRYDVRKSIFGSTVKDSKELDYLMQAAMDLDIIKKTDKEQLKLYNKFRSNGYDVSKLTAKENTNLKKMFQTIIDSGLQKTQNNGDWEEQLKILEGAGAATRNLGIPGPTLLDADFDDYLREIEPLKHYTNKELADLYNIDYDFDSIKADYDKAAEAQVNLQDWISNALANNAERDNIINEISYLDAIRNAKATSIQNGVSSGARAAAELLANVEAIKNKATAEHDVATERFKTMDDALLNRARTQIDTLDMYTGLSNTLGKAANQMYADDVQRIGQDHMFKANTISSDSELRAARAGANANMQAAYAVAAAQDALNGYDPYGLDYFKEITLPAMDYDFSKALADYRRLQYTQNTGYLDSISKYGRDE